MKKEYRLIQVIESIDNITKRDIIIFELTQIEYNYNKTGYNFTPHPSIKNDFFIYDCSENMENFFLGNPEDIKTLDLELFEVKLIKPPDGIRNSYFSKRLSDLRNQATI